MAEFGTKYPFPLVLEIGNFISKLYIELRKSPYIFLADSKSINFGLKGYNSNQVLLHIGSNKPDNSLIIDGKDSGMVISGTSINIEIQFASISFKPALFDNNLITISSIGRRLVFSLLFIEIGSIIKTFDIQCTFGCL